MDKLLERANAHSDYIRSVSFSPDGTRIVSAGRDRAIRMWSTTDLTTRGDQDAFAASFRTDGGLEWVTRLGGTEFDTAWGVAVDTTGSRVIVVGQLDGAGSVDAGGVRTTYGAVGMSSAGYALALDASTGAHQELIILGGDGE